MSIILPFVSLILISLLMLSLIILLVSWRWWMKLIVKKFGSIILTDSYQENLIEIMPGLRHLGVQNMLENSLRAATGTVLERPLTGSSKDWPDMNSLTFIPAQTTPFPIDSDQKIDLAVTIGPNAKKPLKLKIPLLISGMGYGVGISEQARLSLTKAAKNVGTAINSGEGPVLSEELEAAGKYILQFSKASWAKEEDLIKRANMIEIKLGQGAVFGMGKTIKPEDIEGRARKEMGLKENEEAILGELFFENQTIQDLKELVDYLRTISGGVPIGVKIGMGGKLEEDLDRLIEMGVDVIALDGAQAAMKEAPPILCDDFGIPTLHGLVRAVNYLEKKNFREKVSLIVSGGLLVPGHFLKALALGADAVYIGSAMLFTVAHSQIFNALPFEPPTQAVWYNGKCKDLFNVEDGEKSAEHFLSASIEELEIAMRTMGKTSLNELSKKDLVSYDEGIAKMVGIPFSFEAYEQAEKRIMNTNN